MIAIFQLVIITVLSSKKVLLLLMLYQTMKSIFGQKTFSILSSPPVTLVIIILRLEEILLLGYFLSLLPGKEVDKANKFRPVDGENPQGHLFGSRHKRVGSSRQK